MLYSTGLHGEAGVQTVQMKSANDTLNLMLQHMTNTDNKIHLPVTAGDSWKTVMFISRFSHVISLSDYLVFHVTYRVCRVIWLLNIN